MTDEQREAVIQMCVRCLARTSCKVERSRYYEAMKLHIDNRSPEQIARMEFARGLR